MTQTSMKRRQPLQFLRRSTTTVGYDDYTPVTLGGRLTAVALLLLGLVSLAVLTAQIASNF